MDIINTKLVMAHHTQTLTGINLFLSVYSCDKNKVYAQNILTEKHNYFMYLCIHTLQDLALFTRYASTIKYYEQGSRIAVPSYITKIYADVKWISLLVNVYSNTIREYKGKRQALLESDIYEMDDNIDNFIININY